MSIAELFIIAKNGMVLDVHQQMKVMEMIHVCTMEFYSTIKANEICLSRDLESGILNKVT